MSIRRTYTTEIIIKNPRAYTLVNIILLGSLSLLSQYICVAGGFVFIDFLLRYVYLDTQQEKTA
jgi:hypothetical protein